MFSVLNIVSASLHFKISQSSRRKHLNKRSRRRLKKTATCKTLELNGASKVCNMHRFVGPKVSDRAYQSVTLPEEDDGDVLFLSSLPPPHTA